MLVCCLQNLFAFKSTIFGRLHNFRIRCKSSSFFLCMDTGQYLISLFYMLRNNTNNCMFYGRNALLHPLFWQVFLFGMLQLVVSEKINQFDGGVRQVYGEKATAQIFTAYPASDLSVFTTIFNQVSFKTWSFYNCHNLGNFVGSNGINESDGSGPKE